MVISKEEIKQYLGNGYSDTEIFLYTVTDSTNTQARKKTEDGLLSDALFIAEEQTHGRGRCGKEFYSPKSVGLYFSAVLHPKTSLSDTALITSAAAVAVAEAIEKATGKSPLIKWVNDLYLDGKKVCGILTESVIDYETNSIKAVIIGIGINLTTKIFPKELGNIADSLGCEVDKNRLVSEIFISLNKYCYSLPQKDFMEIYRKRSLVLGKTVGFWLNGVFYTAKAVGITDIGELEVVAENGTKMLLNSGEISIKPSFN